MIPFPDAEKFEFNDTSFNLLMQQRIHRILLICSNYDAFMLEEDGRIDEQIFNEYVALNLRFPPVFIQASSAKQAFQILENDMIGLVIEMLNIGDIDTFELAKQIKLKFNGIPIVVLTYFSREVSLKLKNEDLSAIDYVFCWLGNSNLLLAIVKLIEDRMNAEHDIEEIGVQAVLFVEDSIRYISSYLPELYKIIYKQSREFMKEALNEHQKMLRMRGRPKILLARNYEDAVALYQKYKNNMLGIISDISYLHDNVKDPEAGLSLLQTVKGEDPHMPFLLQSSNNKYAEYAQKLNAGFIHKYSKTLFIELRDYIVLHFGFGDFVFRDPKSMKEICRASDLQSLQHQILSIPENSLDYHGSRNHLSKWLNARALFPIARMFKTLRTDDFSNLSDARKYIYDVISSFRMSKGRGIIAQFDKAYYSEYLIFSRIGEGSIGGKARGLAFLNSVIKRYKLLNKFQNVLITIPRTVVIGTDVFDEFMESNKLYNISMSNKSDQVILDHFIKSKLPLSLLEDLEVFLSESKNPIAIRSSSKLEDSLYQPFAGIYSTYMVPLVDRNPELNLELLTNAIKSVYASVYFKSSKAYITATSNLIDEEKMGIIIQDVCGTQYGRRFYPTISGVARSVNFYPIEPEKASDGIVNIAFGLGKYIVGGEISLRFSPKYPKKIIQLSTPEMVLKQTQKFFYALDMSPESFIPSVDDSMNLQRLKINDASDDHSFQIVSSTYDLENNVIRDGNNQQGRKVLTFSNILNHNIFPLAEMMQELLEIGQREMNNPVEIEFAVNLDPPRGEPNVLNLLQIRPIVENDQKAVTRPEDIPLDKTIIYSNTTLGNGTIENIYDFVYIQPDLFNPANSKRIASEIEKLNNHFIEEDRNYILVGPGRWGSRDPWLGIPINWVQISQARLIVESGLENYRIDPSQGTHFFQNLTSFRVGYFTINPYINDGFYDLEYLKQFPAIYEDKYIRHIRFDSPLKIIIDGRNGKGVVLKAGESY
jgi:hypothetical protein